VFDRVEVHRLPGLVIYRTQTLTVSGKEKEIWDPSGKGP